MNVYQIDVLDLDLDDTIVMSIGQVALSLVIAHSYLKSSSDFAGVEIDDESLAALSDAALHSSNDARGQLDEVIAEIRDMGLDDWLADGLGVVLGDMCSLMEDIAWQLAAPKGPAIKSIDSLLALIAEDKAAEALEALIADEDN